MLLCIQVKVSGYVRYKVIDVEFQDINFKRQKKSFSDLTAQIIQHEIDHLDGIVI